MSSSSSSEEEWEDVDCLPPLWAVATTGRDDKPTALEIVLPVKGSIRRGRKQNALEKAMTAFNREFRHNLHKTSLLCLLVQGLQINENCNDPLLHAQLFSLVPRELHSNPSEKLTKILKWFVARKNHLLATVTDDTEGTVNQDKTEEKGESSQSGCVRSVKMLIAVLRALDLRVRLVLALRPIPFKPSRERPTSQSSPDRETSPSVCGAGERGCVTATGPSLGEPSAPLTGSMFIKLMQQLKKKEETTGDSGMECCTSDLSKSQREAKNDDSSSSSRIARGGGCKRRSAGSTRGGGATKKRKVSSEVSDTHEECSPAGDRESNVYRTRSRGKGKGVTERKTPTTMSDTSPYFSQEATGNDAGGREDDSDSDFLPVKEKTTSKRLLFDSSDSGEGDCRVHGVKSDGASGVKGDGGRGKGGVKKHRNKGKMVKGRPQKSKVEVKEKKKEESLSTGIYDETSSWAEVFMEDQKRYVCLHLPSCSVDQPKMCEKHYPHKMSYIIAIDNRERVPCVSDVTARYACDWCTATRRLRLSEWWRETLHPYTVSKEEREREEDDIMNILYSHPLPTSLNDYKSHPLYALRRHLLKFEAIYPPDSEILGYCKSEPVFSRSCVFTLHTRETWLKEGRVVKKDEQPYKVVKARPKKGQSSLERDNSTVEVFGHWQTEVYVPPPVVDGVVPRNEYGNVELFQPSMLPAGACHIRIAGIHKVARKLDISYAPAMMGWDFHSGHCCPVIEGIVVAEENREVLLEAWRQEEQLIIEKQLKKRETRILERWKKLSRGVLIRQRVQKTYSLD